MRFVLEHLLLFITQLSHALLGRGLLLLLEHCLDDFFLLVALNHSVVLVHLSHKELHVALVFSDFVVGHEIKRFLITFNIDFEGVKNLFGGCGAALIEKRDALLIKEVRY